MKLKAWLPATPDAKLTVPTTAPLLPPTESLAFPSALYQLTVPVGATVTWTNDDDETHTVTATDRAYTSSGLEHAERYAHRFTARGTYTYFCALHPHMTATVVVR